MGLVSCVLTTFHVCDGYLPPNYVLLYSDFIPSIQRSQALVLTDRKLLNPRTTAVKYGHAFGRIRPLPSRQLAVDTVNGGLSPLAYLSTFHLHRPTLVAQAAGPLSVAEADVHVASILDVVPVASFARGDSRFMINTIIVLIQCKRRRAHHHPPDTAVHRH